MTFVYYVALGYLAAGLIASGLYHAARLTSFSDIVQSHRIFPAPVAMPLAILVTVLELAAGGLMVSMAFNDEVADRASLLFSLCTLLGLTFTLYVRRLLRNPRGITSCGCSPFASPLTIASIIPAFALALVSLFGLATTAFGGGRTVSFPVVLPLVWGVTLALIINLVPATMPRSAA